MPTALKRGFRPTQRKIRGHNPAVPDKPDGSQGSCPRSMVNYDRLKMMHQAQPEAITLRAQLGVCLEVHVEEQVGIL